jgi:hypothetical protein
MSSQDWITGAAGDWSDAADWQSGVAPGSGDNAVINDSSAVTVTGWAVASSLALNNSTLAVSGSLTLGTTLNITGNSGFLKLNGGALSAQTITSGSGTGATSGDLWGYGTIDGAVNGNVEIIADGGALKVQGSLAGDTGIVMIYQGSTLELSNATSQYIDFNGTSATLKLDAPGAFTGELTGIAVGDTIDLVGVTASSATYSGSTLTINETNGQHLVYNNVSANAAGEPVAIASDNNGGTLVYWAQPPESWITGAAGDWSDAADWQSGVAPGSDDNAVINDSSAVTVMGWAVASSLALNNSTLAVSGSLTLGTTLNITGNSGFLKLNGGALSAQTITSGSGTGATSGDLWGYGTIDGAVNGNVEIIADGGALKVQGSLAGDTGIVMIYQGSTLELSNATSQYIDFNGTSATLKLDAPGAFTGELTGIAVGDTIDLVGVTASSATYSGSTLTINETNGQHLVYNNVSANAAGEPVAIASDNNGGTLVYWAQPPRAFAPTITGAIANQATTSEAPINPFADVTVGDANANATETLTITPSGDGVLTGAGVLGSGGYTLTGAAAQVTSALKALTFIPAAGQPGTSSTTTFTLSDTSSAYATPTVDTTTSVVDTDPMGTGTGDVHIVTFQGLHYDFQAVGDFTLEKGTTTANPFDVQIRTSSWGSMASVTTKIAAQVGGSIVQFKLDGTVSLNGAVDSYLGSINATQDVGGGTIWRTSPNSYSVKWDSGETLAVTNMGTYFNESLTLGAEDGPGSVEGLLGANLSQATDIQLADGTVLKAPTECQLLGIFAESWSVSDNVSLLNANLSVPIGEADFGGSSNRLNAQSLANLLATEPGGLVLAAK